MAFTGSGFHTILYHLLQLHAILFFLFAIHYTKSILMPLAMFFLTSAATK